MTTIKFNTDMRTARIVTQTAASLDKINASWDQGISPVDLEVDTDIFKEVKTYLISEVLNLGIVRVTPKGYSINKKNNRTSFRIINTTV